MSYQEVRSVVVTVTGMVVLAVYWSIAAANFTGWGTADTDTLLFFWARSFLIYIPISIGARIVAMILLAIGYRIVVGEDIPSFDDERDKRIELRVNQVGQGVFVFGFALSMVPIVLGMSVSAMFLILLGAGVLAEVASESVRIVKYRTGVV